MLLDYFYPEGSTPVTPTTGGHFVDEKHKKHYFEGLRKRQNALDAREAEKLHQKLEIRNQLDRAFHPERYIEEEKSVPEAKIAKPKQITQFKRENLEKQLREIEIELAAIAIEREIKMAEARRAREEDDLKALLLAENYPFAEYQKYLKKLH